MLSSLAHRGPDDRGEFEAAAPHGVVWLGNTRLAILDLSPAGHQPMHSPSGRYTITFNGEIYNFQEIGLELEKYGYHFVSRSDTEVILAAWEKWGTAALTHFRGMFALAIWDRDEQTLWLARDRMGEKPLFYTVQGNRFLFASEVRAMLASGVVEKRLDSDGLDSYLTFGSPIQPYTLVKDIKCLEAGHFLKFHRGSTTIQAYWSLKDRSESENHATQEEINRNVYETLLESFRLCMVSDVPVGLLLSGGVDSTSILALLARQGFHNLHTFSVVFDTDDKDYSEEYWSTIAARKFGVKHTKVLVRLNDAVTMISEAIHSMDQPSIDGFNTYVVSNAIANQGFKVAIAGQGADEIFLGYPSRNYFKFLLPMANLSLPNNILEFSNKLLSGISPLLSRLIRHGGRAKNLLDLFGEGDPYKLAYLAKYSVFNQHDLKLLRGQKRPLQSRFIELEGGTTINNILSRIEVGNYLRNTLLRDADQMSMACSLEIRSPYCDFRLVDLVAGIPMKYKIIHGRKKPLLVDAVNDSLVKEISQRHKMGFVLPIENWLRNGLQVSNPLTLSTGLEKKEISKIIKGFQAGQDFRAYWTISVLAKWVENMGMLPPLG